MAKEKAKKSLPRRILKIILIVVLILVGAFAIYIAIGTATEWKPAPREKAEMFYGKDGTTGKKDVKLGKEYSLLSFNVGYAGLGKDADFFMDGGTGVLADSKEQVEKNLAGITDIIKSQKADFTFLQEIDRDSKRSFKIDERTYMDDKLGANSAYADNYKAFYVMYPLKQTTGKVRAGLYTHSDYNIGDGERISLPVPFKWPVRLFNLKRCLLVNRVPIAGTDKELVLVNLHMEAYDDGGGKAAQTKELMDFANKEYKKGNYVIAAGDWNQAFYTDDGMFKMPKSDDLWKPTLIDLGDTAKDWQLAYSTKVPSCRLDNQPYTKIDENTYHYVIDGCLISPNVKVNKVETLDCGFEYSDHNPVSLNFTLQ